MFIPFSPNKIMSAQGEVRTAMPIPMVYEDVPARPLLWEYRLVSINTHEDVLPDVDRLNELGGEGWLLVGVLDQRSFDKNALVHYYFVRQRRNEGKA